MAKHAKFWDKWAERYSKSPIKDPKAYENKLERTQAYFRPEMNVLEFGCGTGSTAITHSPYVKHIKAIDISENMIAIAKQKAKTESIDNIDFEVATLDSLTAQAQTYDVILGLSVLHLLEDWQQALATVDSLLKPGGFFVSSTPCMKNLTLLKLLAPLGQFAGLIPDLSFFSEEELKSSIVQSGLDIDYCWQPKKNAAMFIIAKKALL